MKEDSFEHVFEGKERVMVVMPHPDDLELYAGGTIARLIANGIEVIAVKMTNGGKGTMQTDVKEEELEEIRIREDTLAAQTLGIKPELHFRLNIPDGEVEADLQTIEKLALLVRRFRPNLILTTNPEDVIIRFAEDCNWVNHRDHRLTGQVTLDAAYPYSRDTAFFPHQLKEIDTPYEPTEEFLLADYWEHQDTVYIDITDFVDVKARAWRCHESEYSQERVDDSVDFLNKDGDKYFEAFRYVIAD